MLKYCLLGVFLSVLGCSGVPNHQQMNLKPSKSFVGASKTVLQETIATVSDQRQIVYSNVITRYQNVVAEWYKSTIRTPELQTMMEDLHKSISSFSVVMKQKNTPQDDGWSVQEESVYYDMHINIWNLMNRIDTILGVKTF